MDSGPILANSMGDSNQQGILQQPDNQQQQQVDPDIARLVLEGADTHVRFVRDSIRLDRAWVNGNLREEVNRMRSQVELDSIRILDEVEQMITDGSS